jgi:BirA family transcriptional regulator, biotin operon repressor / biotin---[acetyl-CoA-carboxylase] ligase
MIPAPSSLAAACPGLAVEMVAEVGSTNAELMSRARDGLPGPVLLVADHQTAGRGRLGRRWTSRPGDSLTFSLALSLAPADWSGLSLAVGVALAEALHPRVALKWPNDLWLDGRKLGGILVETAASASGVRTAVIGVGLNLLPPDPEGLSTPPAGLRELLPDLSAGQALQRVVPPLLHAVQTFEHAGFAPFQSRFEARDALRGHIVRLSDGREGMARGVAADGALLVHTAAGLHSIHSSEVSVRPAA